MVQALRIHARRTLLVPTHPTAVIPVRNTKGSVRVPWQEGLTARMIVAACAQASVDVQPLCCAWRQGARLGDDASKHPGPLDGRAPPPRRPRRSSVSPHRTHTTVRPLGEDGHNDRWGYG
jgi:hypothetical protein